MSQFDEDVVIQDLMNTILLVAMEDGAVSQDELAILKQVKLDVQSLRELIIQATQEEVTSEKDVEMLSLFRKNILQNAYDISREDRIITEDERKIINSLVRAIMKMGNVEKT